SEGENISAGQDVMEIETEKAVVELPCPHAGKVEKIHVSSGDTVQVGSVLLTIAESAEAGKAPPEQKTPPRAQKKPEPAKQEASKPQPAERKTQPAQPSSAAKGGNGKPRKVVVLGGGPGGYPAAFEAADKGMEVTLIDDDIKPGGVCLHRGCIPSK